MNNRLFLSDIISFSPLCCALVSGKTILEKQMYRWSKYPNANHDYTKVICGRDSSTDADNYFGFLGIPGLEILMNHYFSEMTKKDQRPLDVTKNGQQFTIKIARKALSSLLGISQSG
ncbi:MAG: hypothetical protein AAF702_03155 [Chloroflexota bacterium]